ncbi:DUF6281 family protein [Nocardioides zhouii]|uniref:Lipoprotein n=1 Tax=Nocardioides zhouii TaxID=1168729 RepID=A0A4Q2T7B0_9ACTN|nr:DUF6281 family protein [Nocardioides zhouii]RYC14835.1 hypothetical protein EUA94_01555 [Nocardioides zhouii]
MRTLPLCLVVVAATACSQAGSESSADCPDQVRLEGVVYTWNGVTSRDATRHASADRAECDDAGEDPEGLVFPDDPVEVQTWTFEGYSPAQVLGLRYDDGSFGVLIADDVAADEQRRIRADLAENQ